MSTSGLREGRAGVRKHTRQGSPSYPRGTTHKPLGRTFQIKCDPSDTILSIKKKLERLGLADKNQIHVIFAEKQLDNNHTLSDYDVKKGGALQIVLH